MDHVRIVISIFSTGCYTNTVYKSLGYNIYRINVNLSRDDYSNLLLKIYRFSLLAVSGPRQTIRQDKLVQKLLMYHWSAIQKLLNLLKKFLCNKVIV